MSPYVYLTCSGCGSMNRVDIQKIDRGPKCAKCKSPLDFTSPIDIQSAGHFDRVVLGSGLPVLVDFWAPWCGPCQSMHSAIERLAGERAGNVVVARVNTDELISVASRYSIRGVPTFILFHEGQEVSRQTGAVPAHSLETMIREARI